MFPGNFYYLFLYRLNMSTYIALFWIFMFVGFLTFQLSFNIYYCSKQLLILFIWPLFYFCL